MTAKEAERKLREIVTPLLQAHGFERVRGLVFVRKKGGAQSDRIGFSVFVDRAGVPRASFGVGVRFEAAEAFRTAQRDANAPTIGLPMHFLKADRAYFDWRLTGETDWDRLALEIRTALEEQALPFLERYATEQAASTTLESEDPRDWFTMDRTTREETLALLDCARGNRERAVVRLSRALDEMADLPEKEWAPLQRLHGKLKALAP